MCFASLLSCLFFFLQLASLHTSPYLQAFLQFACFLSLFLSWKDSCNFACLFVSILRSIRTIPRSIHTICLQAFFLVQLKGILQFVCLLFYIFRHKHSCDLISCLLMCKYFFQLSCLLCCFLTCLSSLILLLSFFPSLVPSSLQFCSFAFLIAQKNTFYLCVFFFNAMDSYNFLSYFLPYTCILLSLFLASLASSILSVCLLGLLLS